MPAPAREASLQSLARAKRRVIVAELVERAP